MDEYLLMLVLIVKNTINPNKKKRKRHLYLQNWVPNLYKTLHHASMLPADTHYCNSHCQVNKLPSLVTKSFKCWFISPVPAARFLHPSSYISYYLLYLIGSRHDASLICHATFSWPPTGSTALKVLLHFFKRAQAANLETPACSETVAWRRVCWFSGSSLCLDLRLALVTWNQLPQPGLSYRVWLLLTQFSVISVSIHLFF